MGRARSGDSGPSGPIPDGRQLEERPTPSTAAGLPAGFETEDRRDMISQASSYTSGISDKPLLGLTIGDMFDQTVDRHPDREALVSRHQGVRYTYRQLRDEVDRCARALIGLGVRKGQRVGIWAPNCAEWTIVQFATSTLGAILVIPRSRMSRPSAFPTSSSARRSWRG